MPRRKRPSRCFHFGAIEQVTRGPRLAQFPSIRAFHFNGFCKKCGERVWEHKTESEKGHGSWFGFDKSCGCPFGGLDKSN